MVVPMEIKGMLQVHQDLIHERYLVQMVVLVHMGSEHFVLPGLLHLSQSDVYRLILAVFLLACQRDKDWMEQNMGCSEECWRDRDKDRVKMRY